LFDNPLFDGKRNLQRSFWIFCSTITPLILTRMVALSALSLVKIIVSLVPQGVGCHPMSDISKMSDIPQGSRPCTRQCAKAQKLRLQTIGDGGVL
jgi:hypothetical protein